MSQNQFFTMNENFFLNMYFLLYLNITNCRILYLPSYGFQHLVRLIFLGHDSNKITFIQSEMLYGLRSLNYFHLCCMQLTTIYDYTFHNLAKLRELKLSNNPIHQIKSRAFWGLTQLILLYLENCNIMHLGNNAFTPLNSIKVIYTGKNISHLLFTRKPCT